MNRQATILVSVCIMFLVSPITTMACPPDCGECYYWDSSTGYCEFICSGCCNCYAYGICDDEDYFCDTCEHCSGCSCDCAVVTSVSGISGPYAIGESVTVTANVDPYLPPGCSIIWGGSATFSNISGTSATATFATSGANLYITARTSCQYSSAWSSPFTVVKVTGVIASPDPTYVGQNVTFGALTDPPNSAHLVNVGWYTSPSGNPAMGAGSQFSTSWSTGGTMTATAICGSSSAQKQVTVVEVIGVSATTDAARVGENVHFAAVTYPPNSAHLVTVTWSAPGGTPSTGSGSQFTTKWNTGGPKTVTATCGGSNSSKNVTVVEVVGISSTKNHVTINENVYLAATTIPPNSAHLVTVTWSSEGGMPATGWGSQWATKWGTIGPKTVTATCGDSSAQKTIYVINVQITEPNGAPAYDHQLAFNSASPGVYAVPVSGTTGIPVLDANLVWTLSDISGSAKTWTGYPNPPKGPNITFTYTGLPSSNSEFGPKTLTLEYSSSGIKATKVIEVFFEPTATNHPGEGAGTTPNWFYYWKQGAVPKLSSFVYNSSSGNISGRYDYGTDTLWVFSSAYQGPWVDINIDLYNHRYQTNINTGENSYAESPLNSNDEGGWTYYNEVHQQYVYYKPDSVAITAGPDGIIDTPAQGANEIEVIGGKQVLHTGWRGRLASGTTPLDDDEWQMYEYMGQQKHIEVGQPWAISVTHGNDDWLQTDPLGDDVIDLTGVNPVHFFLDGDCEGIDYVDVVCSHELMHQYLFNNVVTDNDSDAIDDNYEVSSGYHLCPFHSDTYDMEEDYYGYIGERYPTRGDNEFLAYMSQGQGSGNASQDWSISGKQWHQP